MEELRHARIAAVHCQFGRRALRDDALLPAIQHDDTIGDAEIIQAKYELLKRGTYTMSQDETKWRVKELEPGAPLRWTW